MKKYIYYIIIFLAIVLIVGGIIIFTHNDDNKYDENNLPKFVTADFIDLKYVEEISKFRSGSGHDFSNVAGETCRSMKHYYNTFQTDESQDYKNSHNGYPPPPNGTDDIVIYSPTNGRITEIDNENSDIGKQVFIVPNEAKDFRIRLFHIFLDDNIKKGTEVKAGQKIGVIGLHQNTDIAVETSSTLYSYFEVMTDEVFSIYQKKGVKTRDEFIITKEYRDAHPLECDGEWFVENHDDGSHPENFVTF